MLTSKKTVFTILALLAHNSMHAANDGLDIMRLAQAIRRDPYNIEIVTPLAKRPNLPISWTSQSGSMLDELYNSAAEFKRGMRQEPVSFFPVGTLQLLLEAGFNPFIAHRSSLGIYPPFIDTLKKKSDPKSKEALECVQKWEVKVKAKEEEELRALLAAQKAVYEASQSGPRSGAGAATADAPPPYSQLTGTAKR